MSSDTVKSEPESARGRLVCFVNGIFSNQLGGGDIYFSHIARAVLAKGYRIHFFGGHAFKEYLEQQGLPLDLTLTDSGKGKLGDVTSLPGQFRLLLDFGRRFWGALWNLREVRRQDCAYAMSDYWFDTIPLVLCRARTKILYLGMIAPSLREVLFRGRADVPASRLPSLYYWFSQQLSLRLFRLCRGRHMTYSHPEMKEYLQRFGYTEAELTYVANGMDVDAADRTPDQPKEYDVVWTGRVHPQKGIADLLATFEWLSRKCPDFHAVIIGKNRDALEPKIREMGLAGKVTFSGRVSEAEKFRLLKASRVFVMPSRYESWGIVVGEALAAGVPVVAYELGCYRPVFGEFIRYVKPFDTEAFTHSVEQEVALQRKGQNYLTRMNLAELKQKLSWKAAQQSFCSLLGRVAGTELGARGKDCVTQAR
jgi:glycosyltransferase involved in cell wall biosynthesis